MKKLTAPLLTALALPLALAFALPAAAAPGHSGGHGDGHGGAHGGDKGHAGPPVIGRPGMAEDVTRTIDVTMYDNYYEPEHVTVREGETIRFRLVNKGQFLHEFGLGTRTMHKEHQAQMQTMMDHGMISADRINHQRMTMDHGPGAMMHHEHANSVILEPGKSAAMIWRFGKPAEIEFACNIPGHYESGMVIDVNFTKTN